MKKKTGIIAPGVVRRKDGQIVDIGETKLGAEHAGYWEDFARRLREDPTPEEKEAVARLDALYASYAERGL
jgi:hypothetical protein